MSTSTDLAADQANVPVTTTSLSRRVLCVDDDVPLLEGLRRQLRRDFEVTIAPGPEAGLEALRNDGPFAVVLSDYAMPGMNGVEFLRRVRAIAPEAITIMFTGQADLRVAIEALHEGHIFRFLSKPAAPDAVRRVIADGLEQHRLLQAERLLAEQLSAINADLHALNATLEQRVAERTAALQRMHEFLTLLHKCKSLDRVAATVVEQTAKMLSASRTALFLPHHDEYYLRLGASWPDDARGSLKDALVPLEGTAIGRAFLEGEPNYWDGAPDLPPPHRLETLLFGHANRVCQGLMSEGQPVGVIVIATDDASEEFLANLRAAAEIAAIAVGNQLQRQQRDEARDAVIFALAKLAESRDPETGAHLERVQIYCRLIAEKMRERPEFLAVIDDEYLENLTRSAPLHDIGKVGVPDRILRKPGKLTPEEFELMKAHTLVGGDTLRAMVAQGRNHAFLRMGMEIAYAHHERYDGTGYPKKLRGAEIPLAARILALADVYDALTSPRVYKAPIPHPEAVEIIVKERGKHFDPAVVDAFLAQVEEFDRIHRALAEASGEAVETPAEECSVVDPQP